LFIFSTILTAAKREEPIVRISLEGGGMHMAAALETIRRIEQVANKPVSDHNEDNAICYSFFGERQETNQL